MDDIDLKRQIDNSNEIYSRLRDLREGMAQEDGAQSGFLHIDKQLSYLRDYNDGYYDDNYSFYVIWIIYSYVSPDYENMEIYMNEIFDGDAYDDVYLSWSVCFWMKSAFCVSVCGVISVFVHAN